MRSTASASLATPKAAPAQNQPTGHAWLLWRRPQAGPTCHRQAHTADTTTRSLP